MMKRISVLLIVAIMLSVIGCSDIEQSQASKTEDMEDAGQIKGEGQKSPGEVKYYHEDMREDFERIDKMTEDEANSETSKLRQEPFGYMGASLRSMDDDIEEGFGRREALKSVMMSDRYDLHFSMPNPYTGQIFGELYVSDLEHLAIPSDSVEGRLIEKPLEERNRLVYRNYFDLLKDGREATILQNYVDAFDIIPSIYYDEFNIKEAVFFTIPELVNINSFGLVSAHGVLVARWPEDITNDEATNVIEDLMGDGNFYKHYVSIAFESDSSSTNLVAQLIGSHDDEVPYVENLGPDWELPHMPSFIRWIKDKQVSVEEGE